VRIHRATGKSHPRGIEPRGPNPARNILKRDLRGIRLRRNETRQDHERFYTEAVTESFAFHRCSPGQNHGKPTKLVPTRSVGDKGR